MALDAIRRLAAEELDAEESTLRLLDAHQQSNQETDFLIGSLRPRKLVVVKDGSAQGCRAAWLGDREAFAEYQRHCHSQRFRPPRDFYDSPEPADDIEVAVRMSDGM